ncbi:unnamed protein product, partial [Phaeothamnion confervicola]
MLIDLTIDSEDEAFPGEEKRSSQAMRCPKTAAEERAPISVSSPAATQSAYLIHLEEILAALFHGRPSCSKLFTEEETAVVRSFGQLSASARALYVRLIARKGPWFRMDSMLDYEEVGSGVPRWLAARNWRLQADEGNGRSSGTCSCCGCGGGGDGGGTCESCAVIGGEQNGARRCGCQCGGSGSTSAACQAGM